MMIPFYFGNHALWFGLIFLSAIMVIGDALLGNDFSQIGPIKNKFYLNLPLFISFPLLSILVYLLVDSTKNGYTLLDYIGAILGVGLIVAGYGTNSAHELIHRSDLFSRTIGRWILSLSLNPDFSIEHVYGHHEKVATPADPATALRGENVYTFFIKSTVKGHLSAWKLELKRLRIKNLGIVSFNNLMLTGYIMIFFWVVLFYRIAGWKGVVIYVLQGVFAKFVLEVINYVEHYGILRKEDSRVLPHHSWNSNKRVSGLILYSLTRHSHHHENGTLPYWELKPYPKSPEMPYGYLTTTFISLVPPLWFKIIEPLLDSWDKKYA